MGERSLHNEIKIRYSKPGDQLEVPIEKYIIDIIRDDLYIEIQTRNFSAIKKKLIHLLKKNKVRLIFPVSVLKWIVRIDKKGEIISSRKSPKKGRLEDIFSELVYIPKLLANPNFEIEILYIHSEDIFLNDGKGSWRRRRWSIQDRRLRKVVSNQIIKTPIDLRDIIPEKLEKFTVKQIAEEKKMRIGLTRKMIYSLKKMDLIKKIGVKGRSPVYSKCSEHGNIYCQ